MKRLKPKGVGRNVVRFFAGCFLVVLPLELLAQSPVSSGTVITLAGNGSTGFSGDGGPATNASFKYAFGLAVGRDGTLYIADVGNNRIRALNPTNGLITTIASTGTDGDYRGGIAVDRQRNALYIDGNASRYVFKVNLATGGITDFAGVGPIDPYPVGAGYGDGHPATEGWFDVPIGIAVGSANNVFIADLSRSNIRKVSGATSIISTIAGIEDAPGVPNSDHSGDGGPAVSAGLALPYSLAADRAGNVFVLESDGGRIRRIDAATGIITTVAGGGTMTNYNGPATNMDLLNSRAITVSDTGDLYIANPNQILRVDLATGLLAVYAGTGDAGFGGDGGSGLNARFEDIWGLTVLPGGGLLISDQVNQRIRYIAPNSINLTNDSGQTGFYLPWVSALAGDLIVANNASLTNFNAGSVVTVGGIISVNGNTAVGEIDLSSLTNSGSISVNGNTSAASIDLGSLTLASGDVTINANGTNAIVTLNSLTNVGGSNEMTLTLGGTVQVTNGLTLETNATLAGSSTLDGSVTNNGTISPGSSPGRINITGHLLLGSTSRLRMELGGYMPDQFDSVYVAGGVKLGGTLAVSLINQFACAMTNGASFTLLTAGSPLTGTFINVDSGGTLFTSDGYARFTVHYATESTLRLTDLVMVDSDSDGMPDWWEDKFGLTKTNATDALIDSDNDGATNYQEFLAGTKPNDPSSVFRIVSVKPEAENVRLTWATVGGKSYIVQTNAPLGNGAFTNNFADSSPLIRVPGVGESTTNLVVAGTTNATARYYRIRLGP